MNPQIASHERHTIWHGVLEWIEKAKNPTDQQKLSHDVPCSVSVNMKDGEPELKADSWPQKLIMQLMPKKLIGSIGGMYLRNSKSVLLHPQTCEALESLTKVMNTEFAGCVHFGSTCDIKVLILLYTAEKRAYLGFIPNDQAAFVDRLRKVIQQQKSNQQFGRQGQMGTVPGASWLPNAPGQQMGGQQQIQGNNPAISQPPNSQKVDKCTSQWKSLRRRYAESKTKLPSGSGSIAKKKKLELEKCLRFLDPIVENREIESNICDPVEPIVVQQNELQNVDILSESTENTFSLPFSSESGERTFINEDSPVVEILQKEPPAPKPSSSRPTATSIRRKLCVRKQRIDSMLEELRKPDEDDVLKFLVSLAPTMRKLNTLDRLEVQMEFQKVLFNKLKSNE